MSEHRQTDAPVTLAIDTSSKLTSLCIARGTSVLNSLNESFDDNRSEKLWTRVGEFLRDSRLSIHDVGLFAVCVGPGTFTGLRVGVSAAKGFAAATGKPIVGVTSLEAAAGSAGNGNAILALVNAYRGEVYSQLFSLDSEGVPVAQNEPLVSTFRGALERVAHVDGLVVTGDASFENRQEIDRLASDIRNTGDWRILAYDRSARSSAASIARLASVSHLRGDSGNAESIAAVYVRPAEAEVKLARGLLGSKIERVRKHR